MPDPLRAYTVEQVLKQHPQVVDAAVFGAPDERWGEVVVAAVVLIEGVHPDPDALRAFVGSKIAAYKRPKHIIFRKRLPRNANNELDRATIAKHFSSGALN
jgi:acyl-coenzyme A synthetase/AMP-(fatty) acid ligase